MIRLIVFLLAFLMSASALAHKASDSYLRMAVNDQIVTGQWEIAIRDLELARGIDADLNGKITWGELQARRFAIEDGLDVDLSLQTPAGTCLKRFDALAIDQRSDGPYAVFSFEASCAEKVERLTIDYNFLFALDAQHKGLLSLKHGETVHTAIFSSSHRFSTFTANEFSAWQQLVAFLVEGVWHIWIGLDHILFLICLILPAALASGHRSYPGQSQLRPVLRDTGIVITAFTVAHSISLMLAIYEILNLPSRLVESLIAASVIAAALNNIFPVVTRRLWLLAFGFGLVHGLGFASVLTDLGLPGYAKGIALAGFNLGVEAGQLVIVAIVFPLFWLVRRFNNFSALAVQTGSWSIVALACLWLFQRASGIDPSIWFQS